MTKIVTIIGARPQFVKAAVISRELSKRNNVEELIIHTGQHFDSNMSSIFFDEMKIPKPDYNLDVNGLTHGAMTGQMLEKIESILLDVKPDWVLVYGDTNSTLAGALAAKKLHIKLAHVEAGLRSFNIKMPEEINRILTDRISDLLFCPTETAVKNLMQEGYATLDSKIILSGDVMEDAAIFYRSLSKRPENVIIEKNFILTTLHRAENTDDEDKLIEIFNSLEEIAAKTQIILPLHPRTKSKLENYNIVLKNITVVEPIGYLQMVYLLERAKMIITDSGGLQKEAFFFKKPCVTLREETEWIELVESKLNILTGSDSELIREAVSGFENMESLNFDLNLYGGGNSGSKIVDTILDYK